jgi:chromate transporter
LAASSFQHLKNALPDFARPTMYHHAMENNKPSLATATRFWFKLGLISFGGPAGQIAIMHRELIELKKWISEGRFLHALNYCMVLPGPEAQQLATYIGWLMHGRIGGLIAGGLFVLPAFLLLLVLSYVYTRFGQTPVISAALYGVKAAVLGLVVLAAYRLGSKALKSPWLYGLAALSFIAVAILHVPFPAVVLAAMLAGWALHKAGLIQTGSGHGASAKAKAAESYVLNDDTATPVHAKYSKRGLLAVVGVGLVLWLAPMLLLRWLSGPDTVATQSAWFFTKAALLTFGGAYAVLPYVYQAAVQQYGWLNAGQMMDGLALGESTPGPLILVVTFVGFVAGWQGPPTGVSPLMSALVVATVVTYFTFLPSFIFIFAGGPWVESTRGKLGFTAPLTGVTAAVVGVIASLAVFFAHQIVLQGKDIALGNVDWIALLMACAAFVALWHFKRGVIEVIAVCAALGLALKLL